MIEVCLDSRYTWTKRLTRGCSNVLLKPGSRKAAGPGISSAKPRVLIGLVSFGRSAGLGRTLQPLRTCEGRLPRTSKGNRSSRRVRASAFHASNVRVRAMGGVTVKLSSKQEKIIRDRVHRGEFESTEAFVEQAVRNALVDPAAQALARAPTDDEPETEAERQAVAQAHEWFEENDSRGVSHDQVLEEFGRKSRPVVSRTLGDGR